MSLLHFRARAWVLMYPVLWLLSAPLLAEPTDGAGFFDQTFGDFPEELKSAREQGKKGLLLMFEMDDCPFCHRMKTTVLNRPEVQAFYKANFLIFPVDVQGDVEVTDFSGRHQSQKDFALKENRVRATPVFAFYDLDGKLIATYTGATRDAQEFMWLGDYVVGGHYQKGPFPQYRQERQDAAAKPGTPG